MLNNRNKIETVIENFKMNRNVEKENSILFED